MRRFLKLFLLSTFIANDIKKAIKDLIRSTPEVELAVLLGPVTNIKSSLLEYSNKLPLTHIYGDGKNNLSCKHINILSNNIYLHFQGADIERMNICNDQNALFEPIFNTIKIPFYIKWLGFSSMHFYLFGGYNKFYEPIFYKDFNTLPLYSTAIITSSTEHNLLLSVSGEVLINNLIQYTNNPYIKYIQYIVINPESNIFYIKTKQGIKKFYTDINDINSPLNNTSILLWQVETIKKFINFITDYDKGKHSFIFDEFVKNDLQDIEKWVNTTCNFTRYKELLLLSYINRNSIDNVNELILGGVDINLKALNGLSPLYISSYLGHVNIVRHLISSGAILNDSVGSNKATALIGATVSNMYDSALILLNYGADPNIQDHNGNAPLMMAARKCNAKLAALLLQFKSNVNSVNKNGDSALIIASSIPCLDVAVTLIKHNALINIENYNNRTALSITLSIENINKDLVEALLINGSNIEKHHIISSIYRKEIAIANLLAQYEQKYYSFNGMCNTEALTPYILQNFNHKDSILSIFNYIGDDFNSPLMTQVKECISELSSDLSYTNLLNMCLKGDLFY